MDTIVRRLREARLSKKDYENKIYRKGVEDILNHQLGNYETGVNVLSIKVKSKTSSTVTLDVEYDVNIRIPYEEEGHISYESEVEYRRHTMTLDLEGLGESVDPDDYDLEHVPDGPQGGAHIVVKDKEGNFLATYDTEQEARAAIQRGELSEATTQKYYVEYLDKNDRRVTATIPAKDEKDLESLLAKELGSTGRIISKKLIESISMSAGSTFKNANFTWEILAIKGDYALVYAEKKKWHPYVVAWKLQDDGSWGQGHYFEDEDKARAYLNKRA